MMYRRPWLPLARTVGVLALAWAGAAAQAQNADAGRLLWGELCSNCHQLDAHAVGPMHRGVVGRRAGSAPGYAYSAALADSGFVWTPELLDRWLQNPEVLVPGQKMRMWVSDPAERADLLAYLATLSAPAASAAR